MVNGDARLQHVMDRMRIAVDGHDALPADLYVRLRYQMGWSDAEGHPEDARTGKGVRPLVCVLSCQAVGGDIDAAIAPAAAIELTHEFSLIHDDIEDEDTLRRGRPTLWTLVGVAMAINAGDALFAIARSVLSSAQLPPPLQVELMKRYDRACIRLAEGQHMDLAYESMNSVSGDDYVAMVRRKTGALVAGAAGMGALAGGASNEVADALSDYAESLGVAFQMQDDILGLWGSEERTGKPAGRDLQRRKKTMPVVLAMQDPTLGPELRGMFGEGEPDQDHVRDMVARLETAGFRARTSEEARTWSKRALSALGAVKLEDEPRNELQDLLRRAIERDR